MKIENIDSFKMLDREAPITSDGQIINGEVSVNYSSILTKLIQEAGRWCKAYASDLFIFWSAITERLQNGQLENASYLFGFYETGVDNAKSIINQYQTTGYAAGLRYRAIWKLDVAVKNDGRICEMSLYEVHR